MPSQRASTERRYLIAVGVAQCKDPDFAPLLHVTDDVNEISELFTGELGYRRVLKQLGENPTSDRLRTELSKWFADDERKPTDIVAVYLTGHGFTSAYQQHFFCASDFEVKTAVATGLQTAQLPFYFFGENEKTRPQQVWLIVDTCYSGQGAADALGQLAPFEKLLSDHSEFWTLAAARAKDEANDGAFARAFVDVLRERIGDAAFGGSLQPWLRPDQLAEDLNRRFKEKELSQAARIYGVSGGVFRFLPNPRHRQSPDLAAHWLPKALGAALGEKGSYFRGRTAALRALLAFLGSRTADHRMRFVTGGPGSGKSSVLARLVTLSDPVTRKTLSDRGSLKDVAEGTVPPAGSVDLAIHARGKSIQQIRAMIANEADSESQNLSAILERIEARKKPLRVVIDALDESPDAVAVARELLSPLAVQPNVRLIVGARTPLRDEVINVAEEIDLDTPAYFDQEDVVDAVERRLLSPGIAEVKSPYREDAQTRRVAEDIAKRAGSSFLIAQLVSSRLSRQQEVVDIDSPEWQKTFPRSWGEAYDQEMERFGAGRQRVRDVLRALAYARGRGLPWERTWDAVASAIAGKPCGRSDVEEVRRSAAAYIRQDTEGGVSVYRLFHQTFAEYLQDPEQQEEIERRFVEGLRASAANWLHETRPYLRSYLAVHAAAAGILPQLTADPSFLAFADTDILSALFENAGPEVAEDRKVYERTVHRLGGRSPQESLSYLELAARQEQSLAFAGRIEGIPTARPWCVPWTIWQAETRHRLIRTAHDEIIALAPARLQNRPVIVTADRDGTVCAWDSETGKRAMEPLETRLRSTLAVLSESDSSLIGIVQLLPGHKCTVTMLDLGARNAMRTRELGTVKFIRRGSLRGKNAVLLVMGRGRVCCYLSGGRPTVADARRFGINGTPTALSLHQLEFFAQTNTEAIGVVDVLDEVITVDLKKRKRGKSLGKSNMLSAAVSEAGQESVVWTGGPSDIRGYNLSDGNLVSVLTGPRSITRTLLLTQARSREVLVSGDAENLRIWRDTTSGSTKATGRHYNSLRAGERNGQVSLFAVRTDRIEALDPANGNVLTSFPVKAPPISSLSFSKELGEEMLIVGFGYGDTRLLRAADGRPRLPAGNVGAEEEIVVADLLRFDEGLRLVAATLIGEIRSLDPLTGKLVGEPLQLPELLYHAVFAKSGTRNVLLTGGDSEKLKAWDVITGKRIGKPLFRRGVHALSTAIIDGEPVALVASPTRSRKNDELHIVRLQQWEASEPFACPRGTGQVAAGLLAGRTRIVTGDSSGAHVFELDGRPVGSVDLDAIVNGIVLTANDRIVVATSKGIVAIDWRL
ncbi:MAG TPA: caspase family protein [Thermoanaerobaculia bacterium]|nr:caspase family protein [Thermoanaerobaculia bacterium]